MAVAGINITYMKIMKPGDMFEAHKKKIMKKTFGAGVRLSGVTPNPAKVTQNTSTPMMSAGKGYMPKSQLDAGGVPMKSKSKKVKNKSHKKSESAPVKSVYQKNWIAGAIKKPGALKAELGVKAGSKIPAGKLASATKKGGKEGKRARLAETLKSFHKNKKMCKVHKKSMCKKCS